MKVTILQKDSGRCCLAKLGARKAIQKRSKCRVIALYVLGGLIGLLLSDVLIRGLSPYSGNNSIRVELNIQNVPAVIYVRDTRDIQSIGNRNEKHSRSRLEDSLLLSAILNIVQDGIRREIEAEGFILVDPDQATDELITGTIQD